MSSHDVKFQRCSQEDATSFLTSNTYFFKLKAFDKEFERDENGNYANLDFGDLKDISTIDYHIREFVLLRSGEIEHSMKVRFNDLLMRTQLDGYQLVKEFEKKEKKFYQELARKNGESQQKRSYSLATQFHPTAYTKEIIDKYSQNVPPWLIWEVCTFLDNINFYQFFFRRAHYRDTVYTLPDGVRKLRNASAHHNCVLTASPNINRTEQLDPLLEGLFAIENEDTVTAADLSHSDPLVHDFACIICAHLNLVRGPMGKTARQDGEMLKNRITRNLEAYSGENHLYQQLKSIIALLTAFISFDMNDSNNLLNRMPYKNLSRQRKTARRKKPRKNSQNS